MSSRQDSIIDIWQGVAITNGTTLYSPLLQLNSGVSLAIQMVTQNGGAGACSANFTAMINQTGTYSGAAGMPTSGNVGNVSVAANSQAVILYNATNSQMLFPAFWITFVPSASGTLYLTAYVRRYPN